MSDRYVLKCDDGYLCVVSWDSICGLQCDHCDKLADALVLSYSEMYDLLNLIQMHQVPTDYNFTYGYRKVKLVKKARQK